MVPIEIRVAPRGLAWRVMSDAWRAERIDTLCTRERAIEHALERAEALMQTERAPIVIRVEDAFGQEVETRHAA